MKQFVLILFAIVCGYVTSYVVPSIQHNAIQDQHVRYMRQHEKHMMQKYNDEIKQHRNAEKQHMRKQLQHINPKQYGQHMLAIWTHKQQEKRHKEIEKQHLRKQLQIQHTQQYGQHMLDIWQHKQKESQHIRNQLQHGQHMRQLLHKQQLRQYDMMQKQHMRQQQQIIQQQLQHMLRNEQKHITFDHHFNRQVLPDHILNFEVLPTKDAIRTEQLPLPDENLVTLIHFPTVIGGSNFITRDSSSLANTAPGGISKSLQPSFSKREFVNSKISPNLLDIILKNSV